MIHVRLALVAILFFVGFLSHSQTVFRGVVLEEGTKKPIVARVGISGQGAGVSSSTNGRFLYRKYDQVVTPESELLISAPGYENVSISGDDLRNLYNLTSTIYLKPGTSATPKAFGTEKEITVFWDASASAKSQNVNKATDFINAYLAELDNPSVRVVVFNDKIVSDTKLTPSVDGSFALGDVIKGITYEGATDYSLIKASGADVAVLVSDGYQSFGNLELDRNTRLYAVNTVAKGNHTSLASSAGFYSGSYIPLFVTTAASAVTKVKSGAVFTTVDFSKAQQTIKGVVSSTSGPIQGAAISLRGTLDEYITKADGTFIVPATQGDILQIRYLGMYPKDVLVANNPVVQVEMIPQADMLDEVLVTGKGKTKEKEIDAGLGKGKTKERVGYSVNTITADQIKPNATFLGDVIRGNFAGVQVLGPPGSEVYLIRGGNQSINNELPPLWVVDGAPFADVPYFLDPQNIKSITILKSSIATVRYGTIASGGAFLVKTKAANPDAIKERSKVDQALVKGNDYTETLSEMAQETSPYITALDKETTVAAKYKKYESLSKNFKNSVSFYADNAEYFQKIDPSKAELIRARLAEVAGDNIKALRILSYLYETSGSYKRDAQINERIVALAPREAQSYRDLALAYTMSGEHNKALELYINMLGERILGVDFSEIEGPIGNELKHLIANHKDKIEYNRLPNEWLTNDLDIDIRLVIEWSEQDAPFIFQFVNPKKKFFTWNHTLFENKERLLKERKMGFQFEEFVIDDAKSGEWIVNVQYLGDEATFTIPPYLKYTMYRNYGTDKETKEVKVIKLFEQLDKVSLGRINL